MQGGDIRLQGIGARCLAQGQGRLGQALLDRLANTPDGRLIAVTAITQESLSREGITDVRGLSGRVPNMQISSGADSGVVSTEGDAGGRAGCFPGAALNAGVSAASLHPHA